MIFPGRTFLVVGICLSIAGCGLSLKDPEPINGPVPGQLDLRTRDFNTDGPVIPQGWVWDLGTLWSPADGGRPADLPPAQALGPLDTARGFGVEPLPSPGHPRVATVSLTVRCQDGVSYGLQIGAFPGADRVWVNGVLVWQSGVLSASPGVFRPAGAGTVLTIQPRDGVLAVVAQLATDDPLTLHSEMGRLWILGPGTAMLAGQSDERTFRLVQTVVLTLGILMFLWISTLRKGRKNMVYFVCFLVSCTLKLVVNVEQPMPLLEPFIGPLPLTLYLFLNHGLNLLPFPLLVLFLAKQFPEDVGVRSVGAVAVTTVLVELWELLPFTLLALGSYHGYQAILKGPWSFIVNLYVVLVTLFVFERFYHLFSRKRPLSGALFVGGVFIGLIILVPVPLSYFFPVKYTYFFGWGLFLFLVTLIFSFIRLLMRSSDADLLAVKARLDQNESLERFIHPAWAGLLGRGGASDLRPGDSRRAEAIFVQVTSDADPETWLSALGPVAASRKALLVQWSDGLGIWALESWAESALAFALETRKVLESMPGVHFEVVITRTEVEYRILSTGTQWFPVVAGLPSARLAELRSLAVRTGAQVVLDATLQEGLVIGGWRRHRRITLTGSEIELYEGTEETLALLKDEHLDTFEKALALAREGRWEAASQVLVDMILQNPFDLPARALLSDWRTPHNP